MTEIMSPRFHTSDLLEHMTSFMSFNRLKDDAQSSQES